jgi:hypothetical protein
MSTTTQSAVSNPAALVAIAVAARRSADRDLLRTVLRELREQHGMRLTFIGAKARRENHAAD